MEIQSQPRNTTELRQYAEAHLQRSVDTFPDGLYKADAQVQSLVHELQIHQIELEMQNEELYKSRETMEDILAKYSDLYDYAPMAYFTFDREGTILNANLTAAELIGVDREYLINRRFESQLTPEDVSVFESFLKNAFETKVNGFCEVTLFTSKKTPVLIRMRENFGKSESECLAVATDISELKQLEKDRLLLSKLESAGVLAGGIAHDFNNLFAVILLNLELSELHCPLNEELKRLLGRAKAATLKSRDLSQRLITVASGGESVRKATALGGVIEASVLDALTDSPVRCECSVADDLWLADVDESQFSQIIHHFLSNALEAMPEGGLVTVRAENIVTGFAEMYMLPPGGYVRITISDQGRGIPKEVLPKIFDPYFSTKPRGSQPGVGLGLTMCYSIVQKLGGTIVVDSEPGRGTTFDIYLPASHQSVEEIDAAQSISELPDKGKILVMDDMEDLREAVGCLLIAMGHQVELVVDGQSAVEAYTQARDEGQPFDAVILDLTVPDGPGGREIIQRLLEVDASVRAIIMSGYSKDPVLLDYADHGFKAALVKPFKMDALHEKLSQVLKQVASARPVPAGGNDNSDYGGLSHSES